MSWWWLVAAIGAGIGGIVAYNIISKKRVQDKIKQDFRRAIKAKITSRINQGRTISLDVLDSYGSKLGSRSYTAQSFGGTKFDDDLRAGTIIRVR